VGARQYLPASAVVVEHYDPEFCPPLQTGRFRTTANRSRRSTATVARWRKLSGAVTGFHADGPRFYLLNANGPRTLLRPRGPLCD